MNFQWMIDRIGSLRVFLILGIGLFLTTLVVTLSLFGVRGCWVSAEAWLRANRGEALVQRREHPPRAD